eukprot:COSAG05_NODE_668_length_8004_cov_3.894371_8_plen_42_part_00
MLRPTERMKTAREGGYEEALAHSFQLDEETAAEGVHASAPC